MKTAVSVDGGRSPTLPGSLVANRQAMINARVTVRQLPGRAFDGRVTRIAGTLDPALRTLNVEIDIPNPKGELPAPGNARADANPSRSRA